MTERRYELTQMENELILQIDAIGQVSSIISDILSTMNENKQNNYQFKEEHIMSPSHSGKWSHAQIRYINEFLLQLLNKKADEIADLFKMKFLSPEFEQQ